MVRAEHKIFTRLLLKHVSIACKNNGTHAIGPKTDKCDPCSFRRALYTTPSRALLPHFYEPHYDRSNPKRI